MISLTKSEFSTFKITGRLNLIKKDGVLIKSKTVKNKLYSLYKIYGFTTELVFEMDKKQVLSINPVSSANWISFYSL